MFRRLMPKWKIAKAISMRKNPTHAEKEMWFWLRARKFHGIKFRRQVPMLGFIVDFYCPARRLIIEIDGSSHDNKKIYDMKRDKIFRDLGFIVIHFTNTEVFTSLSSVLEKILLS